MGIIDNNREKENMKFEPDPEIERELAPLRALVCLGKATPELYVNRYHEAGLRKKAVNALLSHHNH